MNYEKYVLVGGGMGVGGGGGGGGHERLGTCFADSGKLERTAV